MSKLIEEYKDTYTFDSKYALCLDVYGADSVSKSDAENIRLSFVGKFPQIRWSYVTAYNMRKELLFQVGYNPQEKKVVEIKNPSCY